MFFGVCRGVSDAWSIAAAAGSNLNALDASNPSTSCPKSIYVIAEYSLSAALYGIHVTRPIHPPRHNLTGSLFRFVLRCVPIVTYPPSSDTSSVSVTPGPPQQEVSAPGAHFQENIPGRVASAMILVQHRNLLRLRPSHYGLSPCPWPPLTPVQTLYEPFQHLRPAHAAPRRLGRI